MSTFTNAQVVIKFEGGTYETNIKGQTKTFPSVILRSALITIKKSKKVIRSEVAGKDGEVIEYIGMGSTEVAITGILTGSNGVSPRDDIRDLNALIDAPIAINVVSPFLNRKGITKLVILDADIPQEAGGISYQNFSLNCISEIPTELRIKGV